MVFPSLPRPVVQLGLAGLLPQILCLVLAGTGFAGSGGPYHWVALAAGCFYAALILSFLGGMWWMAGLLAHETGMGFYSLAVVPSLAGWAALVPWALGWNWPGPSLVALGLLLLASPLVDRQLAARMALSADWVRLRLTLATGLGLSTLALAITAS